VKFTLIKRKWKELISMSSEGAERKYCLTVCLSAVMSGERWEVIMGSRFFENTLNQDRQTPEQKLARRNPAFLN